MEREIRESADQSESLLEGLTKLGPERLRERALTALRLRRFDLADKLLAQGELGPSALIENLRIYQAELEIQNDELVSSQQRIQDGLARFTAFFNSLPIAELVIDSQGLIKEANLAAQELFELRAAHFRQHFFARLIDEPDRSLVVASWSALERGHALTLNELSFRGRHGAGFVGDLHIAPIPVGADEVPQFVCAILDRTEAIEQRQSLYATSERLQSSEAELRKRLAELAVLHSVLVETNRIDAAVGTVLKGVVDALPAAFKHRELVEARIRLPGLSVATSAFSDTPWHHAVPIPLPEGGAGDLTLAYRSAPDLFEDSPFSEGEQRLLEAVATHLAVFLARVHDEAQIRESRERYRVVADFSSDWEYWLGPDWRYRYVSPACEKVSGYRAEDFMADEQLLARLVLSQDLGRWKTHVDQLRRDPSAPTDAVEVRIRARDGAEHWIEHVCNAVLSESGDFLGRRGINRDITERKRFEEALRRSGDFLNATGRLAKVGGWEYDPVDGTMRWTDTTLGLLGGTLSSASGLEDLLALFDARDRVTLSQALDQALALGRPFDMEARLARATGREGWAQITCEPIVQDNGVVKLLGALQDVTARVEAEKSLRQAACVFESTAEGVIITDPEDRILAVNRAFSEITGYSEQEVLGKTPRFMRSTRHDDGFFRAMRADLIRTGQWRGETWLRHKGGEIYPGLLTISSVTDTAGDVTHHVGVFSDISQIKRSEERLQYLATHDVLTGLPNRSLFRERLEKCLQRAKRYERKVGLLFIDLDRFKRVNDTLGHAIGDALLVQVAQLLERQVREVDTIARLGGDEFVIILEDIPASRFAATFADRLMDLFSRPITVQGRELFVTASIGISVYPDNGQDMDTLVKHADIAMYQAKNSGRNAFSFFESTMAEGAVERLTLEQDLRFAVARGELVVHYQPQLTLDGLRLRGVEALCRWQHPRLGILPPSTFIPMAEELGLIDKLGFWVLEQGCRQLVRWDEDGFHVPRVAVNLSVREIERPEIVTKVESVLKSTGLAPGRLELEVTESKIMRRADEAIDVLHALRTLGVTLAIDDFGTGYSSLSYLRRLPLNRLKIDSSFTDKLTQDQNDDAVVRAIIALAHSLGLEVLAEGVETRAQAEFLAGEGCAESQGYLFAEPLTAGELAESWAGSV